MRWLQPRNNSTKKQLKRFATSIKRSLVLSAVSVQAKVNIMSLPAIALPIALETITLEIMWPPANSIGGNLMKKNSDAANEKVYLLVKTWN